MKLLELPNELLQLISDRLPRSSIARLCNTCSQGYQLFLPTLYRHVELGHRTQIKQLEQGLQKNLYLKETVKIHTQKLTLKCRQGGNSHWLIISLFEQLPNVKRLYFRDFLPLSVAKVRQVLATLPRITHLDFQYCDLTYQATSSNTAKPSTSLKELSMLWTDFTTEAIRQLLDFTPNLTRVSLGANHNRKPLANDSALKVLTQHCTQVKDLSVSLQQVKEASLCQVIQQYGAQLEHLSIRCEGNDTLSTIAWCTPRLQRLTIRCSDYTGYNTVLNVLQACLSLTRLEMVSWPLHDVPSIVLDQIRYRQQSLTTTLSPSSTRRRLLSPSSSSTSSSSSNSITTSYIEVIKRTVALDKQDLQQIRRFIDL
jgi:hypothetical protein